MALSVKEMTKAALAEITALSPVEVRHRLGSLDPVVLIDVREPEEFERGHLPGAINIPRGLLEMKADLESPVKDARLSDRGLAVVTYCTGGIGARSALSAQVLKRMGFLNAACLEGGLQAWKTLGGPVELGTPDRPSPAKTPGTV